MDEVRQAFGAVADRYIDLFADTARVHDDDLALIARHLSPAVGAVLDLGCTCGLSGGSRPPVALTVGRRRGGVSSRRGARSLSERLPRSPGSAPEVTRGDETHSSPV